MKVQTTLLASSLALVANASPLAQTSALPAVILSGNSDAALRAMPIKRAGTELQLNGTQWTAGGANVYWLGLVSVTRLMLKY